MTGIFFLDYQFSYFILQTTMPELWAFEINFEYYNCENILGFNIRKSKTSNNFLFYYNFGDSSFLYYCKNFRSKLSIS